VNLALMFGCAILATAAADPSFLSLFEEGRYEPDQGVFRGRTLRYRLFVPDARGNERFPLIVWLHGRGDSGDTNVGQLRWLDQLIFTQPRDKSRFKFYLLAVQCPSDVALWFLEEAADGKQPDDMLSATLAILQRVLAERPIDRSRICLAGVSSGGTACWELAKRRPDLFAAMAPLASSGSSPRDLNRLTHLPVWAFHSSQDAWTPIFEVARTVVELDRLGGRVHLTQVAALSHDCWTAAFSNYHLLDWLLAQRRGGRLAWPPGTIPLRHRIRDELRAFAWWQILAQMGVVCFPLLLAWRLLRKSRLRLARKPQ
jgi:predicted peptidase